MISDSVPTPNWDATSRTGLPSKTTLSAHLRWQAQSTLNARVRAASSLKGMGDSARRSTVVALASALLLTVAHPAGAHQSGCHRWHSCPSDSGSYECGDLGYECKYGSPSPGSSSSPSGKDLPKIPKYSTDFRTRISLRKLRPGARNGDVGKLQTQLNGELLYVLDELLPVTGYYGSRTREAVRQWQISIGQTGRAADGVLGPKQARQLFPSYLYRITK